MLRAPRLDCPYHRGVRMSPRVDSLLWHSCQLQMVSESAHRALISVASAEPHTLLQSSTCAVRNTQLDWLAIAGCSRRASLRGFGLHVKISATVTLDRTCTHTRTINNGTTLCCRHMHAIQDNESTSCYCWRRTAWQSGILSCIRTFQLQYLSPLRCRTLLHDNSSPARRQCTRSGTTSPRCCWRRPRRPAAWTSPRSASCTAWAPPADATDYLHRAGRAGRIGSPVNG